MGGRCVHTRCQRAIWGGLLVWLSLHTGCALPEVIDNLGWKQSFRQPFSTLNPEDDNVAQVDVATVNWRRDQPLLQGLWTELDEQFLPLETRQHLAQHGLRLGLMRAVAGSRLQATLGNPEFAKEAQTGEIIQQAGIMDNNQVLATPLKKAPVCTVEARRLVNRNDQEIIWPVGQKIASARLLVPDAEKDYLARDVSQVELQFALQLQKEPDGMTRLRLVPTVKCALSNNSTTNPFLESLKLRNAVNKLEQRYEKLAVEVTLGQDQYLVVTATPVERPFDPQAETWGDLGFMSYPTDQQTVLVFRGASVEGHRTPVAPKKGTSWPLAWQTSKVQSITQSEKPGK
jgi:hypothetical protein